MSVCMTYHMNDGKSIPLALGRTEYYGGNTAIVAISPTDDGKDYELFAYLSCNLGESMYKREFYLDDDIVDIRQDLSDANIARETGILGYSRFHTHSLMRLSDAAYEQMDVINYNDAEPFAPMRDALFAYVNGEQSYEISEFVTELPMPESRTAIVENDGLDSDYEFDIPL